MEWILLLNGITPYLYYYLVMVVKMTHGEGGYGIYLKIFFLQLLVTIILSIFSKDKARLAKVTMITKLIQIPYFVIFFFLSVALVVFGTALMGIGLLMIPIFVAIDFGVFLTTVIPEEICTIKLKKEGIISIGKLVGYLIGNTIYVVDIVLSILIHKEFKKAADGKY